MANNDKGKVFESQLVAGFRHRCSATPFVMRIKDGAQSEGATTKNPADIIAVGPDLAFLIECKAVKITKAKSMPWKRVKPHQLKALCDFSAISDRHFGMVALLFYNDIRGKQRIHYGYMIEAREFRRIKKLAKRGRFGNGRKTKSLPFSWMEDNTVTATWIAWDPGVGWNLDTTLNLQRVFNWGGLDL